MNLLLKRYDTGSINGILEMPYFKENFSKGYRDANGHLGISSTETSLIVSILSVGTILGSLYLISLWSGNIGANWGWNIGALGASPFADWLGRRWGLIMSCQVFNIGVALQVAATEQNMMIVGRAIAGFGVGLVSAIGGLNSFQCPDPMD